MSDGNSTSHRGDEEIIKAFDREQSAIRDLAQRHHEELNRSRERDRQVLIERRRRPR
jgi:hypothetical protein